MKYFIIFSILLMAGCSNTVLQLDSPTKRESAPAFVDTNDKYLWGIFARDLIAVDKICAARGINSIETTNDGWNGFWNFFTFGIYMPADYEFYCNR